MAGISQAGITSRDADIASRIESGGDLGSYWRAGRRIRAAEKPGIRVFTGDSQVPVQDGFGVRHPAYLGGYCLDDVWTCRSPRKATASLASSQRQIELCCSRR